MKLLFNLFAFLTVLSFLGDVASVGIETLSGHHNISVSGTELTVSFSPLDRIFLGTWVVSLIFAVYFYSRFTNRK